MTNIELPRVVAATVATAGALAAGKHTPIDATAGPLTMTLPAASTGNAGAHLSVEKLDATANAVSVSGSIRGANSTITLVLSHETVEFRADPNGSWWPQSSHKTLASLDGRYDAAGAAASAVAGLVNGAASALDTLSEIDAQLAADEGSAAALAVTVGGKAAKAANLSDLASAATARTNLGLGTAATQPSSAFAAAGTVSRQYNADGLLLTPIDGGPDFFSRFRYGFRTDPYFFPLGLHLPTVAAASDIATHLSAGVNYYHGLTASSDLTLLAGTGIPAMLQWKDWGATYSSWKNNGGIAAISLDDERDMIYNGAGGDQTQGYADQQTQLDAITKDGRFLHANYSKGVAFYGSDQSAARYVNDFTDTVSMDVYWMTDPNTLQQYQGGKYVNGSTAGLTQTQTQMGYLYGSIVNRVRSLVSPTGSKPMFNFIELGHTAGDNTSPTITAAQINSAAWHSIIAGARGLAYFDQAFTTGNVMTDADIVKNQSAVRTALATTNQLITKLAPVLNAPTVTGFCSIPTGVAASVKYWNGSYYLIAGSTQTASQSATFTINVPGFTTATVVGESRAVSISAGALTDTFADQNTIHIYKIAKG